MKLVAVSDTHGDHQILEDILTQQPEADAYLYAGDSEFAADDPIFNHYQAVRGNMDFDQGFPMTRTLDVAGLTIFLTHGHRFSVGFTLKLLIEAAAKAKAQVAIFGHTHQLGVEMHQGILVLNPGSISQPRGEFASLGGTYAVIEATDAQFTVTYYLRNGQPAPELTRRFGR
ncbi:metallophosphoesterase [Lacticaseibacillus camelliae]|uniref:Phosphoesterase n=1 Tax=Lacticaseibacillus camelliae DSM 22697 = JCM 13995 TaxID=1423730 RepID=A0A0R2F3B3_9LACO|nr:metallophosphoesterase [Lacticaseibacillus camelliae]KRN23056.1 phosphoesterase [Lacticaseibacillus camelliae DSM 22697 = JCM 13995]